MAGNLWSAYNEIIYKHSGGTSTITTSFSAPEAGALQDLAWDGSNLWSCNRTTDKIYQHSGGTATVTTSFSSPSSLPYGLTWDGTNLWSSDSNTKKIYKHSGGSSTITTSFASPDGETAAGLTWDGSNLWSTQNYQPPPGYGKLIKYSGGTSTITTSFSTPNAWPTGFAFDGENLWEADIYSDKIYKHSGLTATITTSWSSERYGLTWEPVLEVTTQAADTLVPGGATLNGNITSDGGKSITEHGFVWKAGSDPVNIAGADGYSELGAGSEGAFDQAKTGLTEATLYYCRAYATNETGDGYGDAVSFTTGETLSGAASINAVASMTIGGCLIKLGIVSILAVPTMTIAGVLTASVAASINVIASLYAQTPGVVPATMSIDVVPSVVSAGHIMASGELDIEASTSVLAQSIKVQYVEEIIEASASLSTAAIIVQNAAIAITASSSLDLTALAYITKTMGFTGTLSAGDVLIIDTDNLTVTLNGANAREDFTGEFWHLFDGTNELAWHDSDGSRTVELKVEHEPRSL